MPSMTTNEAARPEVVPDGIDMAVALTERAVAILEYIGFRPADEVMDADLEMQAAAWGDLAAAAAFMGYQMQRHITLSKRCRDELVNG